MKRLIAFITAVLCVVGLFGFTASAEEVTVEDAIKNELWMLQFSFEGIVSEEYIVFRAMQDFRAQDNSILPWERTIPADEFEAVLNKYFVVDDGMLEAIKAFSFDQYDQYAFSYDEAENTYSCKIEGIPVTGFMYYDYYTYEKVGSAYKAYYSEIKYESLASALPEGVDEFEYAESLGFPESIKYGGKTYFQDENSWAEYYIKTPLYSGKVYTVEVDGDNVRIISYGDYTAEDLPGYVPPLEEVFDDGLWLLNGYYEYGTEYIVKILSNHLYVLEDDDYSKPTVVSAKIFEDTLNKFFAATDDMIAALRNYEGPLVYDEENETYSIYYFGGFGGFMSPRRYMCYGDNNDGTYDVFYQTINYDYLSPEGYEQAEAEGWPNVFIYGGVEYQNGIDGYYRIESYAHSGYKYHVSINDDYTVRLLSVSEFEESELPGYKLGDIDGDYQKDASDAIYLLYNVFFGKDRYPMLQSGDFDGNEKVEAADAIYLLYHVFFGEERYPLNVPQTPPQNPGDGWTGNF